MDYSIVRTSLAMLKNKLLFFRRRRYFMSTQKTPAFHGSDLEAISAYYNIPKESIVGFGANVNPLGLSDYVRRTLCENIDVITRYPDRNYVSLRNVIAKYCNVDAEHVVTGNGSTELISLLISQRNAKHALVIGPTYSEYERELSLTGGKMSFYNLKEENDFEFDLEDFKNHLKDDVDFLILCNPNNPTSSVIKKDTLESLIRECHSRNVFVMIDETYVEFAPCVEEITATSLVKRYNNFMILRGVSKFFAAPGIRLGYGITSNEEFLQTLKKHQNPWSLNSLGSLAGELMLTDSYYIKRTRDLLLHERDKMCRQLETFKYAKYYKPYGNFILVKILNPDLTSQDVFEHCIKQGLMIRDCSSFESLNGEYIRFCMMSPKDNQRLLTCLSEVLN